MQYYRIEGINRDYNPDEKTNHNDRRELDRAINRRSKEFNSKAHDNYFFFENAEDTVVSIGAIVVNDDSWQDNIAKFISKVGLRIEDLSCDEITLNDMRDMLRRSDREDYIDDAEKVLEKYAIDNLEGWRGIEFAENLIDELSEESCYREAQKYLVRDEMSEELDRIFACGAGRRRLGHPVHYFVETDDMDIRKIIYRNLLSALYLKGRIGSKRYAYLDADNDVNKYRLDRLYNSCIGGTVIIRFTSDSGAEDEHADASRETIEGICKVMQKYKNQVLTIFCMPRECNNLRSILYENLGESTFVEIKESFVNIESAVEYLKMRSRERGIRYDKKLQAALEDSDTYLASELNTIFESWCERKLRTNIYPQYKELEIAKTYVVKEKPKGTAYDELMQMIGLESAKKVINNAINYFKAQKVFADKGINNAKPAMHMIFTGNPGTAKTTVARLFARIMRENGIMSKGHLVEVGRGDLVGKYVGWTAPTIMRKFAEAKGGVLFIDEAYSLVDDRDGSFGDEAINTIVQEMENHREDVVVIFAGYPDKMEQFLNKNPGLRSRIAYHINFDDYNTEELCEIATLITRQNGMKLADDTGEKLIAVFDQARKQGDFGNGRYARNVIEKARMAQANRLMSMDIDKLSSDDVKTICAADIDIPIINTYKKATIGFCA